MEENTDILSSDSIDPVLAADARTEPIINTNLQVTDSIISTASTASALSAATDMLVETLTSEVRTPTENLISEMTDVLETDTTLSTDAPISSGAPILDPSISDPPISDSPISDPPISDPPISDPPISHPSISDPPISDPSVSDPPISDPISDASISDASVSDASITDALTSEAPITPEAKVLSEAPILSDTSISLDVPISTDALSVAADLTSVDNLETAEELTSASVKASAEALEAISITKKISNTFADCDLEEELKRLHEGDPPDEETNDTEKLQVEEPLKSVVNEDEYLPGEDPTKSLASIAKPEIATIPHTKNMPVMKDSDLEEMLSADEVLREPTLIKEAQEDIKTTDVLVCGKCHDSYNFVEEFQEHKYKKCTAASHLLPICEGESKPQVWGFTLWKNKQNKLLRSGEPIPSSWTTYQKWCKLSQIDKNAWILAGQTLQYCNRIGTAKLEVKEKQEQHQQPPVLIQQPPLPQLQPSLPPLQPSPVKLIDRDPLALDGFDSNKENSMFDNSLSEAIHGNSKNIIKPIKLNKEATVLPVDKKNDLNSNIAVRTIRSEEKGEYAVERIMAKRFNPKKKSWEYQIKWEHFPSDHNTWEPLSNLNHCRQMVDEFEEQLRKLKAEKAKQQAANRVKPTSNAAIPTSSSSFDSTPNRPQRTSKQKALNQVKAWCGNISDTEDGLSGGVKRPHDDDDSDESFEKKMKYEDFSDDDYSDPDEKPPPPKFQFRKIAPKTQTMQVMKNGLDKLGPIPQNVLIPDANGVVRINQKQLPSLSTGVYIMSKTAGIIKLDSTTSKVAASGGQTIVKVAPKIGQTQIKIVKKDGTTTTTRQIIQMTPPKNQQATPSKTMKTTVTKVKKPIEPVRRTPELIRKYSEVSRKTPEVNKVSDSIKNLPESIKRSSEIKITPIEKTAVTDKTKDNFKKSPLFNRKISEATSKLTPQFKFGRIKEEIRPPLLPDLPAEKDDSDDGLEELPFPDEISVPEPESPPGDFVLDPFTGKLAGVEYPDPPPPPEVTEEVKSDESLDNIVKLAAADITEDDLKHEPIEPLEEDSIDSQPEEEEDEGDEYDEDDKSLVKIEPLVIASPPTKKVMKLSTAVSPPNRTSILNKVLSGPQMTRKTLLNNSPGPKVQQRILNQSVARSHISPVSKSVNYVRTKPMAPKPKFNIAGPSRMIKTQHEMSPRNVYSYSRPGVQTITRKIGNTTIRSTNNSSFISQRPQARIVQTSTNVHKISPRKESLLIRSQPEKRPLPVKPKPKTIISMPSLIGDDESMLPAKVFHSRKSPTPPANTASIENATSVVATPAVATTVVATSTVATPAVSIPAVSPSIPATMSEAPEEPNSMPDTSPTGSETPSSMTADMSMFTLADNENPIFITGDDGTVYQVAGQNEQGQTILLTQGSDGQQQCLLVTNEVAEAMETSTEEPQTDISVSGMGADMEPLSIKTESETTDQVVAQVVRAEPPSPGGTHKVVVMLPDGNLMVTQVSPEEYASLELE